MNKKTVPSKSFFTYKTFGLFAFVILMIISAISPIFLLNGNKVFAQSKDKYMLKDIPYQIAGTYTIMSAMSEARVFDVENGYQLKSGVSIIAYQKNNQANQRFDFHLVGTHDASYVYSFSPLYTNQYYLDISGGLADSGTKLQLWEYNNTNAQKFVIKELYELINDEYKYVGYVILTGTTNYIKCLGISWENKIEQQDINWQNFSQGQIWYLGKAFSGYAYQNSGYLQEKAYPGTFNSIDYGTYNKYSGYYLDAEYWSKYEDFLCITTKDSFNPRNARITDKGYTFLDNAEIDITIKNALGEVYDQFLWWKYRIDIGWDNSQRVNGKAVNGTVGKGTVEVEHIDENNKSFSRFTNNVFESARDHLEYQNKDGNHTFNKSGKYVIRVYYKVQASLSTYVMKEFQFAIASSSTECEAVQAGEKDKSLSSYALSLDNYNNIVINYNGKSSLRAKDNEIISYVARTFATTDTNLTEQERIQKLKDHIRKFNQYKVYFTNTAFYLSSANNPYVNILESITGYSSVVSSYHTKQSPLHATDGIYEYVTTNTYVFGRKNFYKVYLQSQPNKQVFRNVTYCYKNSSDDKIINYAIDYSFLEDLKIFPYTMTLNITYQNLSTEYSSDSKIEYQSNSIIYNTTNDILKLRFEVNDISGNSTALYLYIFPANIPSMNEATLKNISYRYNYISSGYSVPLYDSQNKVYKKNLFSTQSVALQNFLTNIIENQDICKRDGDNYTLTYDPNNAGVNLSFDSNEDLVTYLYELFEQNVKQEVIDPNNYNDYVIAEKEMHFDKYYLTKDYYLTTDENFPLFESFKTFFSYYNTNGELLKEGIITYNGEYKYGDNMFKILADNQDENWVDGYVKFLEFNISSNKGNEYTAYISKANSKIGIKYRNGAVYKNLIIKDSENIDCEEFTIYRQPDMDTIYAITFDGETKLYDYYTFSDMKFTESGDYIIKVINTHGFNYNVYITVSGLASFVDGVDNIGETNQEVTFRSGDFNFEYYINGKKQDNNNYAEITNGDFIYKFAPSNEDKNVFITKNGMTFAFVVKGNSQVDTSPYFSMESTYATPKMVRDYKLNIKNKIDNIDNQLYWVNNIILNPDFKNIKVLKAEDVSQNKYDDYLSLLNTAKERLDYNERYIESFVNSDNVLLKQNPSYNKIFELQGKIEKLENLLKEYENDFNTYSINYFANMGISIPANYSKQLLGMTQDEIMELYYEYAQSVDSYKQMEVELNNISANVDKIYNASANYMQSLSFISSSFDGTTKLTNLSNLALEITDFENNYINDLIDMKNYVKKMVIEVSNNPFIQSNLVEELLIAKQNASQMIDKNIKVDLTSVKSLLKQTLLSTANKIALNSQQKVDNVQEKLDNITAEIRTKENEKTWWKFITNKELDKKIELLKQDYIDVCNSNIKDLVDQKLSVSKAIKTLTNLENKSADLVGESFTENLQKTYNNILELIEKIK